MGEVHHLFAAELVLGLVAFGKFQCIKRGLVTSRVSEIVGMDVHGMGETEVLVCFDQSGDNFSWGDVEVRDRVVHGKTVQSPCPCFCSTGVDDLDSISLGYSDEPCDVSR